MEKQEPEEPLAIPPAHVARLLSLSLPAVKKLIASGALPSFKLGKSRRVPLAALRELIEQAR